MKRCQTKVAMAPLGLASDGSIIVNANQLGTATNLDAVIGYARATGLPVFVGVVVPGELRRRVLGDVDDALADVVGRLGPKLVPSRARRVK